jgi:hypothetical protein
MISRLIAIAAFWAVCAAGAASQSARKLNPHQPA